MDTPSAGVRILAISGSLRRASSNGALVRAAAALAPPGTVVAVFEGLANVPPFNPDDDRDPAPPPVAELRASITTADAIFLSSPEYAHGVPGVLKNGLDWLVGSGELIGKPVAIVNASPHASHAHASLTETLTVMSARVIREASITIPVSGYFRDSAEICADTATAALLQSALDALLAAIR